MDIKGLRKEIWRRVRSNITSWPDSHEEELAKDVFSSPFSVGSGTGGWLGPWWDPELKLVFSHHQAALGPSAHPMATPGIYQHRGAEARKTGSGWQVPSAAELNFPPRLPCLSKNTDLIMKEFWMHKTQSRTTKIIKWVWECGAGNLYFKR